MSGHSKWHSIKHKKGAADANLTLQTNGSNAVVIDNNQNANFVSTGAITLPKGTTAQRPTGANGYFRYNTTSTAFEMYAAGTWKTVADTTQLLKVYDASNTQVYP